MSAELVTENKEDNYLPVTWGRAWVVTWAVIWRVLLLSLPFQVIYSLSPDRISNWLGITQNIAALITESSYIIYWVILIFGDMWIIKIVFAKPFKKFHIALLSDEKEINYLEFSWKKILTLWWAISWRGTVIMLLIFVVSAIVVGGMAILSFFVVKGTELTTVGIFNMWIGTMALGMYGLITFVSSIWATILAFKLVLQKKFHTFRIVLIENHENKQTL